MYPNKLFCHHKLFIVGWECRWDAGATLRLCWPAGTPALRNLVKGVTRYIFGYLHEGKGKYFGLLCPILGMQYVIIEV